MLSDFVPLFGSRRRSYLLIMSLATTAALGYLFFFPPAQGQTRWLLFCLLVPTLGIAFIDVVIDALMVQYGQPYGLTGRFQSIQWTASYLATILTGSLGGWLSSGGRHHWGFAICGIAAGGIFLASVLFVREPATELAAPVESKPIADAKASGSLWPSRLLVLCGLFLILWSFNPFSSAVLQAYMANHLQMGEQFYGHTVSISAIGSVIGSAAYGFYCRRISVPWLLHGSVVLGIVASSSYWCLQGKSSAVLISLIVGFSYVTANLIQMDLAAQVCRPETAATTFAILMSATNLSLSLGMFVGGKVFEVLSVRYGAASAFHLLVGIGSLSTAACWLIMPWMLRELRRNPPGLSPMQQETSAGSGP